MVELGKNSQLCIPRRKSKEGGANKNGAGTGIKDPLSLKKCETVSSTLSYLSESGKSFSKKHH